MVSDGLASHVVLSALGPFCFQSLTDKTLWQPCCLFQLCRARQRELAAETAAAWCHKATLFSLDVLLKVQKRRNYENTKSHVRFDWDDVFVRGQGVGTAGEDRLRSQRKLWAIQDLQLGKGPNERPAPDRPDQGRRKQHSCR